MLNSSDYAKNYASTIGKSLVVSQTDRRKRVGNCFTQRAFLIYYYFLIKKIKIRIQSSQKPEVFSQNAILLFHFNHAPPPLSVHLPSSFSPSGFYQEAIPSSITIVL